MWLECIKAKVQVPFMQNILETHNIQGQAQQRIATTTRRIAKRLQIHYVFKRRVKKIYDGDQKISYGMDMFLHKDCKVSKPDSKLQASNPK